MSAVPDAADVLRVGLEVDPSLAALARRYGAELVVCAPDDVLPGSFWGDSEAGLQGHCVFVRADTPLHSFLHELSHFICMAPDRRSGLDRDAGGDDAEECGVCYLQIVLADELATLGRDRMLGDMDRWGYTFRLGSARAWFEQDAQDARRWLREQGVLGDDGLPTFRLRA
jgi:hypothetical protein